MADVRSQPHPVRLEGALEAPSRWLWLLKWLTALPHFIILFFLFIAFMGVTLVAFFAILFTGRYPRGLFGFNVGVMRWSWRVGFYSYSALGTDRYPPFSMAPDETYPATLDVAYPEHLSRGLVLVKWLLVFPHAVIVGIFLGTSAGTYDDYVYNAPGLISALVLFAGIALLFTARYPGGIFAFVVGLNRWVVRTAAYLFLLTDVYPPFRLDQGGSEPSESGPDGGDSGAGGVAGTTSGGAGRHARQGSTYA